MRTHIFTAAPYKLWLLICILQCLLIGSILTSESDTTTTTSTTSAPSTTSEPSATSDPTTTTTTTTSTTESPDTTKRASLPAGQGKPKEEEKDAHSGKIVNGRPAGPGELPFQASISAKTESGQAQCGGVLIDEQHVLTAAHCIKGACQDDGNGNEKPTEYKSPEDVTVTLGEYSLEAEDGEVVCKVSEVIPHEDYVCGGANDIAVLKLSEPVQFQITEKGYGSVNRVSLPEVEDAKYESGDRAIVAGWGLTDPALTKGSDILQIASVEIMDDGECEKNAARDITIATQICATDPDGSGSNACRGDSGGPLLRPQDDGRYDLVGLVSFGSGNCDGFSVYTRVNHYLKWIAEKIGQ